MLRKRHRSRSIQQKESSQKYSKLLEAVVLRECERRSDCGSRHYAAVRETMTWTALEEKTLRDAEKDKSSGTGRLRQ